MNSKYSEYSELQIFGNHRYHYDASEPMRLEKLVFASSEQFKISILLNHKTLATVMNSRSCPTVETEFSLPIDPGDNFEINIQSIGLNTCSAYITLMLESRQDEYDRAFSKALEETLTT